MKRHFQSCVAILQSQQKKKLTSSTQLVDIVKSYFYHKKDVAIEPKILNSRPVAKTSVEGGLYYKEQDKFVFSNGVEVHWTGDDVHTKSKMSEKIFYKFGDKFEIDKDYIQLDNAFNTKLAISIAMSRSVLLEDIEKTFDNYLIEAKRIPQLISEGSFNKLKKKDIERLIGQFMQLRFKLNLTNNPYVELSEFTWNDVNSERVMKEAFRYFDIYARVAAMNRKLDYASEITGLLKSNLTERHGFRLEWIIIILIALELALSLSHEYREYTVNKAE